MSKTSIIICCAAVIIIITAITICKWCGYAPTSDEFWNCNDTVAVFVHKPLFFLIKYVHNSRGKKV